MCCCAGCSLLLGQNRHGCIWSVCCCYRLVVRALNRKCPAVRHSVVLLCHRAFDSGYCYVIQNRNRPFLNHLHFNAAISNSFCMRDGRFSVPCFILPQTPLLKRSGSRLLFSFYAFCMFLRCILAQWGGLGIIKKI